jgi:hypothetical protein
MSPPTTIELEGDFDHPDARRLNDALARSMHFDTKLPDWIAGMQGMSGRKYRYLINNLIASTPDARYLEVGSWAGSTACSAMSGNSVKVRCIDNWSTFDGPRETFVANVGKARSADVDFKLLEMDFRSVNYATLGKFNVYLFDGPHSEADQFDGVTIAQPALDDTYLQIVDDWNWEAVRAGTLRAIEDLDLLQIASVKIRTSQDNKQPPINRENSDWHNGYGLFVLKRKA